MRLQAGSTGEESIFSNAVISGSEPQWRSELKIVGAAQCELKVSLA